MVATSGYLPTTGCCEVLKMDRAEVPGTILTNIVLRESSHMHERPAVDCTVSPNPYTEALTATGMVFVGGALGR